MCPNTDVFQKNVISTSGYVSNPNKFLKKPVTHFSSLKFDADDEFFSENWYFPG